MTSLCLLSVEYGIKIKTHKALGVRSLEGKHEIQPSKSTQSRDTPIHVTYFAPR